ncbi:MAG: sulfotransferase [Scytonema sp. PMC 1069.18]|nr:sulfotransferase [Scytonema sp. PMC 1069.18]MEC4883842.1 sulfotransferase [Scytonema sp. PMC 1070.18]
MNSKQKDSLASGSFILSCGRSGSSLLRYILDTHVDIASPGELNTGKVCQDLYHFVASTVGAASDIADVAEKNHMVLAEIRQIMSGLLNRYAAVKNKSIWCEKTPSNLDYIDTLKAVFPDAKYICLYRHAMDTVHSLIEIAPQAERNSQDTVSKMVNHWINQTKKLLIYERDNSAQCFRIKYESIVTNPTETLEPLFTFLGVAWDISLLDKVFSVNHDPGLGDPKLIYSSQIHQNSIGKGAKISRSHIPEPLLQEMNTLLEELDYPVVGSDWDNVTLSSSPIDTIPKQGKTFSSIEEIFLNYLPERVKEWIDKQPDSKTIYKIVITGDEGGIWTIDLTKPSNWISTENGKADCTVTLSSQTLMDIINGKQNPAEALMEGKVDLVGDMLQAEMLGLLIVEGSHKQNLENEFWWRDVALEVARERS